jgi:hypothetical protein
MMYGQSKKKNADESEIHSLKEVAVPPAFATVLQKYFNNAIHSLAARAMVGPSETCNRS